MVRNDTLAAPGLRNLGRVFRASKHQLGNEVQAGGPDPEFREGCAGQSMCSVV